MQTSAWLAECARSPAPRNPLLTAINRTLTNHRAKIAGWNVRVVVGCS